MDNNSSKREKMQLWLDSHGIRYPQELSEVVEVDGQKYDLRKVLGHLWHCTDILPAVYCEQLDIPYGSTYAKAIRDLFKTLKKRDS